MLQQPQVMRTHAGSLLDAVQQARKGVPALRSQAAPFRHAQAVADARKQAVVKGVAVKGRAKRQARARGA